MESFDARHEFALFAEFHTGLTAFFRFAIQGLRHGRGSAHFTNTEDLNLKGTALILNLKRIANADVARCLDGLAVCFNPAYFAGARCQRSGFEEA